MIDPISASNGRPEARRSGPSEQAWVDGKRAARMAMVDGLSPALRLLVHDFGFNVVKAFLDCGLKEPRHIRHLVNTVLDEFSPTRGSFSSQGIRNDLLVGRES